MNHCHFCGNNIPDEVDTCAQANYACDGPRTKESNTPDTEWEGVEELGNIGKNIDAVREKLNEVIRGLNKIERLTVSRDTYWKERVRNDIEAYKNYHNPIGDTFNQGRHRACNDLLDNLSR